MRAYYKAVNTMTMERIEPELIGGIQHSSIISGPFSRLFTWLFMDKMMRDSGWRIIPDDACEDVYYLSEKEGRPEFMKDMTKHYVDKFNELYPEFKIGYVW